MRLDRIQARDFRALRVVDMDLTTSPVHFVSAPNRTGKTSLRAAIAFAFTGLALGLKLKKAASVFARKGSTKCKVTLNVDGIEFSRTPTDCTLSAKEIAERWGGEDMLGAVFNVHRFLSLSPADRMKLVRTVAGDSEKVAEEVRRLFFAEAMDDKADLFVGLATDNLDMAEKLMREARAETTRAIEALGDTNPPRHFDATLPDGTVKRFDLEVVSVAQQAEKLAAVKKERDATLERRGVGVLARPPEELNRLIGEVDAKLNALKVPTEVERTKLKADEGTAQEALSDAKHAVATAEGALREVLAARERFGKLGEVCAACGQDIPKAHAKRVAKESAEREEKLKREVYELKQVRDRAQVEFDTALVKRENAGRALAQWEDLQIQRDGLLGELKDSVGFAEADKKLAELDGRIALGEKILAALTSYHNAKGAGAKRAELERRRDSLDTIAKAFGKDGRIRELAASGFDVAEVQKSLSVMLPGSVVGVNDDWTITLDGVPAEGELLSGSERFLLGAAFAATLAKSSGLGILILDEADVLVGEVKASFVKWLGQIAPSFERVIVLAASPREPIPSEAEWLTVWQVTNGTVAEVTNVRKG